MDQELTKDLNEQDKKISLLTKDLASLEDYIHDLFNFSPLPICFVSPAGIVLEVNPALENISNYSFDEIVGNSIDKIFEKEKIKKLTNEVLGGGRVEGMGMKIFLKGKKFLPTQVFARVRKNEQGKIVGFFLGVFDLTKIRGAEGELKKTQTALLNILEDTDEARRAAEKEEERTRAIIVNFADGLLVFDVEHRLILINPQAEIFFGIKKGREKVIGKLISEFSQIPKLSPLIKCLGAGTKEISKEELELRKDLILEVSSIGMKAGKENIGRLIILHDVTREKTIERLKTEFVSISAHQLRTPLSAVKWTLRLLLDGDLGQISDEQKEFLEKTYASNETMIDLVNSLLNVSRIEEGRFVYRPAPIDLSEMVMFVINDLKDEMGEKNIKFFFKKPRKPLPKVFADKEKIAFAIQNLITNAVRYTLSEREIIVSLKQVKKGKEVEFKVKDQGIGIPENQQKRIFTKFFRGANAIRLEVEGTGLGLFITKNIIEAHKGKIGFKSEENKGTTFWFTLPASEK